MCKDVFSTENQQILNLGIKEFSTKFEQKFNKKTIEGNKENYEEFLNVHFNISKEKEKNIFKLLAVNYRNIPFNLKSEYVLYYFLTTIRELSLLGYFTSQEIYEDKMFY